MSRAAPVQVEFVQRAPVHAFRPETAMLQGELVYPVAIYREFLQRGKTVVFLELQVCWVVRGTGIKERVDVHCKDLEVWSLHQKVLETGEFGGLEWAVAGNTIVDAVQLG